MTQETKGPFSVPKKKEEGRYFWLKLPTDFFQDKAMKKLRRYPGGAENLVVALKILLLGVSGDNRIYYDSVEDSFAEEIALSIDERPESVESVVSYLLKCGWLVKENEDTIFSVKSEEMTGSITARGARKQRQKEREMESLSEQSSARVPLPFRSSSTEKRRKEKKRTEKKRTEIEKMLEGKELSELVTEAFMEGKEKSSPALSDVEQYAEASHFHAVSPDDFYGMFSSQDWTVDGKDITDWMSLYLELERLARNEEGEGGSNG